MEDTDAKLQLVKELGQTTLNYSMDAIGAIVILIVGWWLAGWVRRTLIKLMNRTERIDATLRPFIANVARYTILVLVLVAVLAQFGVPTTSIIAVLGAAGLAIGLALQGTLQNIAAGFMLLLLRPFQVGDFINAGGLSGTVDEIGLFVSHLTTIDGLYLTAPNSQLWGSAITNYSRAVNRRCDLPVGIGYGDDVEQAEQLLRDLVGADERVLADPEPLIQVTELGDSAVVINLRYWTKAGDFWATKCDMTKAVKQRLDAAGISIPFPQRDVHIHSADPDAKDVA